MKLVMALVIVLHGLPALAQQTQALRGRVVAEESFAPLAGARILIGMRQVSRTDDRGQFQVMVPKGLSQLRAEKSGFVTRTFEARGASTEVRMTRGANLTVRVVDETGQPVPLRRIRVAGPIGVATRTVDEFGERSPHGTPGGSLLC